MKHISSQLVLGVLVASALCEAAAAADNAKSKLGAAVYEKWCAACHSDGDHFAGTVALRAKYNGAVPAPLLERTDLTPELIAHFVRNGFSIMPFFRKTEISDEELAALTSFMTLQRK